MKKYQNGLSNWPDAGNGSDIAVKTLEDSILNFGVGVLLKHFFSFITNTLIAHKFRG